MMMATMKVYAHRGLSGLYPENTMVAFQRAAEAKFDAIELDVQLSRDGQVVIIHDETVDRTTDGSGLVMSYSLADLRRFDASRVRPQSVGRASIPSFEEYCEWASSDPSVHTNIEIKSSLIFYPGLEEKTFGIIQKYHLEERVFFSSFNHLSLVLLQRIAPGVPLGLLAEEQGLVNAGSLCSRFGFNYFHPALPTVTEESVAECHEHGVGVQVWTVDAREDWDRMTAAKVDAVFSNFPHGSETD
jgi:glycerophosphoryl diester phosphodiesterase